MFVFDLSQNALSGMTTFGIYVPKKRIKVSARSALFDVRVRARRKESALKKAKWLKQYNALDQGTCLVVFDGRTDGKSNL